MQPPLSIFLPRLKLNNLHTASQPKVNGQKPVFRTLTATVHQGVNKYRYRRYPSAVNNKPTAGKGDNPPRSVHDALHDDLSVAAAIWVAQQSQWV